MKSILLSSSRRDFATRQRWLELEAAKGLIPAALIAIAGYLGAPIPAGLALIVCCCGAGWAVFVLYHATTVSLRLNRKHEAYMKATGVNPDLRSMLGDRRFWRKSLGGRTMREFIAERRTPVGPAS